MPSPPWRQKPSPRKRAWAQCLHRLGCWSFLCLCALKRQGSEGTAPRRCFLLFNEICCLSCLVSASSNIFNVFCSSIDFALLGSCRWRNDLMTMAALPVVRCSFAVGYSRKQLAVSKHHKLLPVEPSVSQPRRSCFRRRKAGDEHKYHGIESFKACCIRSGGVNRQGNVCIRIYAE